MDARIAVRFYTVFPLEPGQPSFEACLRQVSGFSDNPVRDVDGTDVQLSNLVEKAGRFSGDLLRLQDENLPTLVKRGKKPLKLTLKNGVKLGHHTAFLYDSTLKVLAYQVTRNAVPLTLFNGFVIKACDCMPFGFVLS